MDNIGIIIDYIAETNLFNFAIFVAIIAFICLKINVKEKLEDAKQSVFEIIEKSEDAKKNSENMLNEIEEGLEHIGQEIDLLMQNSANNAESVGQKTLEDAKNAVATIQENAERTIENTQNVLRNDLIKRVSFASVEIAKLNIIEELNNNKDLHDKLINESIQALEGVTL